MAAAPAAHASDDYLFAASTSTYVPLTAPTVVAQDFLIFTGTQVSVPIGFTFRYWGNAYTTFLPTTFGYGAFGGMDYGFYPFYAALKGLGDSQVGYVLDASGGAGHRILKVEWKHMGFQMDATGTDHVDFQFWLREGSDQVEVHFGPSSVDPSHYQALFGGSTGPQVVFDQPSGDSFYNLQGPAASPMAVYHPFSFLYVTGYAPTGTVYTFTPSVQSGIAEADAVPVALTLYPQPAADHLYVQVQGAAASGRPYTVLDLNGRVVLEGRSTNEGIDVGPLASGTYVLRMSDGPATWTARFVRGPH